ncbi:hypothetical protein ACTMNS_12445, partial [Staphylococcus haemolyticus]
CPVLPLVGYKIWVFNPKPNNLDRRFRIYSETLSRFSCAASCITLLFLYTGTTTVSLTNSDCLSCVSISSNSIR